MRWEVGSVWVGLGVAVFSLVAPLLGLPIPRVFLVVLFCISVILMLIWPVHAAMARVVANPQKRLVPYIRIWGSIGIVLIVLGSYIAHMPRQSNAQLREQAFELGHDLRLFQLKIDRENAYYLTRRQKYPSSSLTEAEKQEQFQESTREILDVTSQQAAEFGPLRTRAMVLRTAMLKQLSIQKPGISDNVAEAILEFGQLAGVRPASEVATYIETLARSLPE